MYTFKDCNGKDWTIEFTIGTCIQVKDKLGIDLLSPEDDIDNFGDLITTLKIIYILCQKSIDANGYDYNEAELANFFTGDVLVNAREKYFAAYQDFFQSLGWEGKKNLVELLIKQQEAKEKMFTKLVEEMEMRLESVEQEVYENATNEQ